MAEIIAKYRWAGIAPEKKEESIEFINIEDIIKLLKEGSIKSVAYKKQAKEILIDRVHSRNNCSGVHIITYLPDTTTSIVDVSKAEIKEAKSPDGTEFVRQSLIVVSSGNDLVFCSKGRAGIGILKIVIEDILCELGLDKSKIKRLGFFPMLSNNNIEKIRNNGVKSFEANIFLPVTELYRPKETFFDKLNALLSERKKIDDYVYANISITAKKGKIEPSHNANELMINLAESLVVYEEDDIEKYKIILNNGEEIKFHDLEIKRKLNIKEMSDILDFEDAYNKLEFFLKEVKKESENKND